MGSSTRATCQCGYHASILIGGGRQDFKTTCYCPSLCEACQAIVQANLFARPVGCPQCLGVVISYEWTFALFWPPEIHPSEPSSVAT
jgi:hypothetical protein